MLAPITMEKLLDLVEFLATSLPESARAMARLSMFDWLTVASAATREPVAEIVRDYVAEEGGRPAASVFGLAHKVPPRAAALANGTISHALDYDDTHFGHIGHPSVAILPAALALAEARRASASVVLDAFLIGAEASIRVGLALGRPHYERGFHQTATAGAFGATVAAARVLGLARAAARQALSLVSTRASGLKSQFGTMGKPYNAGIAAANGVEAAELAERGFVSCFDGLGGLQGFIDAHGEHADEVAAWSAPAGTFLFEEVKYKLHACCHGLHATIEALKAAKAGDGLAPSAVDVIEIQVNPRWLRVCDIKRPQTGLEAKFSFAMIAAMTIHGIDTAADRTYTEGLCRDPRLVGFLSRVNVIGDGRLSDTASRVRIRLTDGSWLKAEHDLAARIPIDALAHRLRVKSAALLGESKSAQLWAIVASLDERPAADLGAWMTER